MTAWLGAIVAALLLVGGAVFLLGAATGVWRFPDALQRMHAATKAGTIGAAFTVAAAMVALQRLDAVLVGLCAILFLFASAPVASHLLGRAIYVSGAALTGLAGRDALRWVFSRRGGEDGS